MAYLLWTRPRKSSWRSPRRNIAKGNNKDPAACAAAQACLRQIPDATAARVHIGRTYIKLKDKWVRFHTSRALRTEIVAFDRGGEFEPGEYLLTPMQPSHRATGKTQGSAKRKTKPSAKIAKNKYHVVTGIRAHGAAR